MQFQINPPSKYHFDIYVGLSPDGKQIVFTAANDQGVASIWVRDFGRLEARQLPGTENAWSPFWSPDSKYLAFAQQGVLKKIDLAGGPPQTIAEVNGPEIGLGAWSQDGTIVFGSRGDGPIRKVSATGGTVTDLTAIDGTRQETTHAFPVFLRDGKRFLYWRGSSRPENTGVYVASIETPPNQQDARLITLATFGPLGLVTDPAGAHLLVFKDGNLLAHRFDIDRATTSGDAVTIAERVGSSGSFGFFGVGSSALVYRSGISTSITNERLTWFNRKGETVKALNDALPIDHVSGAIALSPDGQQAAVMRLPASMQADIWTVELSRGIATRITFNEFADVGPVWSADGSRLAFRSGSIRNYSIFSKDLSGTGEEMSITPLQSRGVPINSAGFAPTSWSKDGRFLFFNRGGEATGIDLIVFDTIARIQTSVLSTAFDERDGRLSPDGRTLAYQSNESGATEIYLRPFAVAADGTPAVGAKWRVSTAGGAAPKWRGDGKELFFRGPGGEVMAVDVLPKPGAGVQTDLPRQLFTMNTVVGWDVAADGQQFLMSVPVNLLASPSVAPDPITVILNWKRALAQ